jgi:hypothetical protein
MTNFNGAKISGQLKREILNGYPYRWTIENETRARQFYRAGGHNPPSIPLVSDETWLSQHSFAVTSKGKLDRRKNHADPACLAHDWKPE